jgi:hypothetical protein
MDNYMSKVKSWQYSALRKKKISNCTPNHTGSGVVLGDTIEKGINFTNGNGESKVIVKGIHKGDFEKNVMYRVDKRYNYDNKSWVGRKAKLERIKHLEKRIGILEDKTWSKGNMKLKT